MARNWRALFVLLIVAAGSPIAAAVKSRSLSFVHTHIGETLTCTFSGGADDARCLAQLKHLLRDWRNGEAHDIDPALFDILFDLRGMTGSDAPFEIISSYRSPATNQMLRERSGGVAEKSLHMQGKAIDVRLRGFSTARLGELARAMRRGGSSYYPGSDFVHIDTGRVRTW